MTENFVNQIEAVEDKLRHAMLTSDVGLLDALISSDLHLSQSVQKFPVFLLTHPLRMRLCFPGSGS